MQNWEQIEQLYFHALELDEQERTAFLLQVSTQNQGLATRLEKMLNVAFQTNNFMESLQGALWQGLEELNIKQLEPGTVIGKYTIEDLIGKGGMGQVYAAHRSDGAFDQKVAIKILGKYANAKLDEQRILGKLQHPNIAQIFDAGTIDGANAYIVMERVDGMPIDHFVQQHQKSLNDRLALFIQVCKAIHFSHQNLVLHQDIKPANILVDANETVKVLDFGIGQWLDADNENQPKAATPFYASPEQLRGENTGTSSDVFQLGILLYKLICDALPFTSGFEKEEITRLIEPQQTQAEAFHPHPKLKGELLSIVSKCLAENPEHRYTSAQALEQDVRDFLEGKAIDTHSKTGTYRTGKFVRKHKLAFAAGAIVLLSVISALVLSLYQADIARKERDKAQVTNDFLIELFASADPFVNTEKDLKEYKYLDFIRERKEQVIADQQLSDEQKWEVLALLQRLFFNLTQWSESRAVSEAMLELAKKADNTTWLAESYFQLGSVYTQEFEFDQAEAYFELLGPLLAPLAAKGSDRLILYAKEIGLHYHLSGDYPTAETYYKQALNLAGKSKKQDTDEVNRTYGNYSQLLRSLGKFDSALLFANKSIEGKLLMAKGDSFHINLSNAYADRALIYMEDAEYALAEKDFANSIAILENKFDSLNQNYEFVLGNYVVLKNFKKEHAEATHLAQKLKKHVLSVYGAESVSAAYAYLHLGESLTGDGLLEEALDEYNTGQSLVTRLLGEKHVLFGIFNQLQSRNAILKGDFEAAEQFAQRSLEVFAGSLPPDHYRQQLSKIRALYAALQRSNNLELASELQAVIAAFKDQGKRVLPYLEEVESYMKKG